MFSVLVSVRALKGEKGTDVEVPAPVGIAVTTDDGRIVGMSSKLYVYFV